MSGRFPPDLFVIGIVPFIALILGAFLGRSLIAAHADHRLMLGAAVAVIAVFVTFAAVLAFRRRRGDGRHR